MNRVCSALMLTAMAMIVGCGDLPPAEETAGGPAPPAAPAPAAPGDPNAAPAVEETAPADAIPAEEAAEMPTEAAAPAGEVAGVGVGAKGQNYGGPGFVTTPVEAYFRTGERIAFEVQIPKAMQLYKAEHNNKGPKTHEEFMDIIIKENGVQLPELPAGEEFVYDPKTEQLLVKAPAQ